jgi:hypothetical protein
MIKQILLSSVAGVFVTLVFLAPPNANAACQGYCADKKLVNGCEMTYSGCNISYDANDKPYSATCAYVGSCGDDDGGGGELEI